MGKTLLKSIFITVVLINMACNDCVENKMDKAIGHISENKLTIENGKIKATWKLSNNIIGLKEIQNHLDSSSIDLEKVALFKIHLRDKVLTNTDFTIMGEAIKQNVIATDSLPTYALREKGVRLSANLESVEHQLKIEWSAILRDSSNYIQQNIKVQSLADSIYIDRITYFDGKLENAAILGNVLGSPIVANNYFFGYEHPTALSDVVVKKTIGSLNKGEELETYTDSTSILKINLKDVEFRNKTVTVNYLPENIIYGFNIHRVTLLKNGTAISEDEHDMYGKTSNLDYILKLPSIDKEAIYTLEVELSKTENCAGQFFLIQENKDYINFYTRKEMYLKKGESFKESSVIGVAQSNQMRRAFLKYIERERARPYEQFLHYNSWYDLSEDNVSYNLEQAEEVIHQWGEKFIRPFDIDFGGFALDDGWDDLNDLWRFNKEDFPNGFGPLAEEAKRYNTGIGAWMSPFGGYAEPKKKRVATALRDGFETTDKGLSLAGPNYYQRFLETALDFIGNNEVSYFKFDGFGGSDPKYLSEMESATRLVKELRKAKPDVFINVTTGTWPSPFWLLTADCTWRGGWDVNQAGVGNKTQKWITFRDGTLYNNVVRRAPLYPLNSIMHHGIVYANRSWGKDYTSDDNRDFADQVFSYFGSGTALQELYISHDRMNKTKWRILAKGAKWAKENEAVLVDTHWIGGDPFNLDIYGWASWNGVKGIVTLRNPSDKEHTYVLDLNKDLEIEKNDYQYSVSEPLINKESNLKVFEGRVIVRLKPFEGKILEIQNIQK